MLVFFGRVVKNYANFFLFLGRDALKVVQSIRSLGVSAVRPFQGGQWAAIPGRVWLPSSKDLADIQRF